MNRQSGVLLFFVLGLAVSLVAACGTGGNGGSSGSNLVCTNGCYCATGCGQLYRCSTGQCNETFCCCTGGSCARCGCD